MPYRSLRTLAATALLALAAAPALATDNQDRRVILTNETEYNVVEFYASRVASQSWEENMLRGGKVLSSGQAAQFNFDDGTGACLFDFKAVFSDGDTAISQRVNVCKISEFYLREN